MINENTLEFLDNLKECNNCHIIINSNNVFKISKEDNEFFTTDEYFMCPCCKRIMHYKPNYEYSVPYETEEYILGISKGLDKEDINKLNLHGGVNRYV